MKILCVGGPLDGRWVTDVGNTLVQAAYHSSDAVYTKQTVSNETQVFTIYFLREGNEKTSSLLHRLVHGYRG